MPVALTEAQIREVETSHPEGLSSQELVGVFTGHRVRFSEANLRRYVQLGLVPRSRRVGQKGKHLGSRGVYPIRAVRRINTIKKLMAERYTIEEIQARFLTFKDSIETLDEAIGELVQLFETKIEGLAPADRVVRGRRPRTGQDRLRNELRSIKELADQLMVGAHRLEKLLIARQGSSRPRGGGAASPTELL